MSEIAVTPTDDPFTFMVHADGSFHDLSPQRKQVVAPPIETRREYAKANYGQHPLYLACRLYVAQIALGLIR